MHGSAIPDSRFPILHPVRIALVAGEASGDQIGAGLIAELQRRHPQAEFAGVGGDAMRAAGLDAWQDCSALAVMGLAEVVRHLPRLLRLRRGLRQRLINWRPDVFIGIDAPDFNLGLERVLKQRGIRTVHYVSPSVWAWREKRAAKIGRSADRVLCLFPMEPAIYARHRVDARFVGHPLADAFALEPDRSAARAALALPADGRLIALLPGSRLGEINKLGADFLRASALLLGERPKLKFIAPMANAACRKAFSRQLDAVNAEYPNVMLREAMHLLNGRAHEAMIASDLVLLASGTAALEAMLAKRPMVVAYRIARATQAIVKGFRMLKIGRYSLPNILAGESLVPELMQGDCTPAALADALRAWLDEPDRVQALLPRFRELHLALRRDASVLAADAVDELLAGRQ
ncbi:MAG TPA: lipid-A-disaccharide synthase [Xanthomonadaceae bacterium]|nr:lipid-A-disaccharide synthase [Xanthomonadaceae bacterium]